MSRKIKIDKDTEITKELIQKIIEKHKVEKNRIVMMKDYYNNKNYAIMNRQYSDPNKPKNKLSHGYCSYITDNFVGYMFGKPVTYKSENTKLLEGLNDTFMYNDEDYNNTMLAQEQSICGYAYELVYAEYDEKTKKANIRFQALDTEETIVVYDNTLEEKELLAIRIVTDDEEKGTVYVYTKDSVEAYTSEKGSLGNMIEGYPILNNFTDVPICTYENNKQRIGDFEKSLSLIDAIDQANSDTANDFEYFTNALLVISGLVMNESDEDGRPLNFKDNRVLNFADAQAKAEYLIKNINDTALENYKNRLNQDIMRFSNVIDMSDENFANNASGVALKWKLNAMENIASIKEAKFKKGLMKRIELITNALNLLGNNSYTYTEIKPVFTRNVPSNDIETVDMVTKLKGIVSDDTILSILPFINDVEAEKKAIKDEQSELYLDNYSDLGNQKVVTNE